MDNLLYWLPDYFVDGPVLKQAYGIFNFNFIPNNYCSSFRLIIPICNYTYSDESIEAQSCRPLSSNINLNNIIVNPTVY